LPLTGKALFLEPLRKVFPIVHAPIGDLGC